MTRATKTKARVIRAFVNSNDGRLYCDGDVFEGTAKQVANLAACGYVDTDPVATPVPVEAKAVEEPEEDKPAEDAGLTIDDIKPKRPARKKAEE